MIKIKEFVIYATIVIVLFLFVMLILYLFSDKPVNINNIIKSYMRDDYQYVLNSGESITLRQFMLEAMDKEYLEKDSLTEKYNYLIINGIKAPNLESTIGCLEIKRVNYNGYPDVRIKNICNEVSKFNINANIIIKIIGGIK